MKMPGKCLTSPRQTGRGPFLFNQYAAFILHPGASIAPRFRYHTEAKVLVMRPQMNIESGFRHFSGTAAR